MAAIYRIINRFKITGRGVVYIVKLDGDSPLYINDILYDMQGNRVKVKGFEMLRMEWNKEKDGDPPKGIFFELIDKKEAQGNILVKELEDIQFLFCNHPLYQRCVDEDYEAEYQAAGLNHSCALFSYEDMEEGKLSLYGDSISGLTIYRGWMMKPDMYRRFYQKLEEKGIILINTPKEYETYHLLPNWYDAFSDKTAESIWTDTAYVGDILNQAKTLEGAYIVKDYVKSRKHEWYDACFIPNISELAHAEKVIANFVMRQGESLVGGIVLRRYEKLKQMGFHETSGMPISDEYRVFIYAGRVMAIDDYWTDRHNVSLSIEEHEWIEEIAQTLNSNFVTVDLARKTDGSLIIIEFGDGQVSGLQQMTAKGFYRAFPDHHQIYKIVKKEIDNWNPYGLLPDAPEDEFRDESERIACQICPDSTIEEIAQVVSKVFSDSFEETYFRVENCMKAAKKIKVGLDEKEG